MASGKYDQLPTKAAKIRAMLADGMSRSEVAKALGISYQHVRNVEVRSSAATVAVVPGADEIIELRVPSAVKQIIEHAAHLSGRGASDFIVSNAFDAATAAIERIGRLALSARDSQRFAEALANPPEPNPQLRALMRGDSDSLD